MKTSDLELLLDSNIYDEVIFKTTEYTLQYLSSISLLEVFSASFLLLLREAILCILITFIIIHYKSPFLERSLIVSIESHPNGVLIMLFFAMTLVRKAWKYFDSDALITIITETSKLLQSLLSSRTVYCYKQCSVSYHNTDYPVSFMKPYYSFFIPVSSFLSSLFLLALQDPPVYYALIHFLRSNPSIFTPFFDYILQYKVCSIT